MMAPDYNEYLAVQVLNERQYVSYRSLSRALKVHVNLAKQMLYAFHRKENAKKANSVHAVYLICGTRRPKEALAQPNVMESSQNGHAVMPSSPPFPSSSMPQNMDDEGHGQVEEIARRSVLLAKEEHLAQAKQAFDNISSIHIYSLQPSSPNDLQVLTECNRKVASTYATEDPLEAWKQYGTIKNGNVRRRARRTLPPAPAPADIKHSNIVAKNSKAPAGQVKTESKPAAEIKPIVESRPASRPTTADQFTKGSMKPAAGKISASDIFKSFAKGKPKVKTEESQDSAASSTKHEQDDVAMGGFSDDEDDQDKEEVADEPSNIVPGKTKKEREAELQAMMDKDDDESMEDADTPGSEPQPEPEPEPEPNMAIDSAAQKPPEEPHETVTVENGRRRGKRRIMKKVRTKDKNGFLVTREEAAWESFSEEEPAPKKAKPQPLKKSGGGRPGQGNITSFFGKK